VYCFEVDGAQMEDVRRAVSVDLGYPMLEEYDFRKASLPNLLLTQLWASPLAARRAQDTTTADLPCGLKPSALIRDYQEKSLSKMFGNGGLRAFAPCLLRSRTLTERACRLTAQAARARESSCCRAVPARPWWASLPCAPSRRAALSSAPLVRRPRFVRVISAAAAAECRARAAVAVDQWERQIHQWTTLWPQRIKKFTAQHKELVRCAALDGALCVWVVA
jgi:hypothetical protein